MRTTEHKQTPALERFTLSDNQRYLDTNRQMEADADGEWVRYSDVASLLADRERLQTENDSLIGDMDQQITELKAEVERLTRENTELRRELGR